MNKNMKPTHATTQVSQEPMDHLDLFRTSRQWHHKKVED